MHLPTSSPRRLTGAAAIACAAALTPAAALAATSSPAAQDATASARCATSGLVVWLNVPPGNGYAGGAYYDLEFTNLSGHACSAATPGSRRSVSTAASWAARRAGAVPRQPQSGSPATAPRPRNCRSRIQATTAGASSGFRRGRECLGFCPQRPGCASTHRTRAPPLSSPTRCAHARTPDRSGFTSAR